MKLPRDFNSILKEVGTHGGLERAALLTLLFGS